MKGNSKRAQFVLGLNFLNSY